MAVTRGKWEVNVGDEVWVSHARIWTLEPVEKIGPKLVHVRENRFRLTPYILDTGQRRDGYPGGFQTQAQRADESRRADAVKTLREKYGIEFGLGRSHTWTVEGLEMLLSSAEEIAQKLNLKIRED